MKFNLYSDVDEFKADVYEILLEDEVYNNLPIGIINGKRETAANWMLSTVTGNSGVIVLIAICTPPFNLLLSKPKGVDDIGAAADQLIAGFKNIDFTPPGILAESSLAQVFASKYRGINKSRLKSTLVVMKLDKLVEYHMAPGFFRMLTEDDLSFTPSWEHAFCIDCDLPLYTPEENEARIRSRLGKNTHFIWEDGQPVAQAACGRETPNSAVISWVYTPPEFRGNGYATSVVAEVTKSIFGKGKQYCCLFADAANPVSRNIYRKLGFYDVFTFNEIKFDTKL